VADNKLDKLGIEIFLKVIFLQRNTTLFGEDLLSVFCWKKYLPFTIGRKGREGFLTLSRKEAKLDGER
jgi:hypothetical protein